MAILSILVILSIFISYNYYNFIFYTISFLIVLITKTLSFKCADNGLVSSEKSVDAEGNEVTTKFYSKSFVPALRAQFCQKNKAGQWVPKAAFASAGMPTDSGLA